MSHPTYTPAQLRAFWAHINFPPASRHVSLSELPDSKPATQLAFLELIMRYALNVVPFENLTLHYSVAKTIVLDKDVLLNKVVGGVEVDSEAADAENGFFADGRRRRSCRGGYCMENNLLLGTVLRSLGFKVRSVGGRVWEGAWTSWGHMVNLVDIAGTKHVVDIGFGSFGPVRPYPLPDKQHSTPDAQRIWPAHTHIAPASARYVWRNPGRYVGGGGLRPSTDATAADDDDDGLKLWVYETRPSDEAEWRATYCFTELEYYAKDYGAMNMATSTSRTSPFTKIIIGVRFVFRAEVRELCRRAREECGQGEAVAGLPYQAAEGADGPGDEIVGKLVMVDNVKLKVHGHTVTAQRNFETESERTDALARWFSIHLTAAEKRGIANLVSEIKAGNPKSEW